MKYIVSIIILLNVNAPALFAQADSIPESWSWKSAEKIVKISPLDFFSVIPTIGADVEVKMPESASLQAGIGVIPSFLQYLSAEGFNDYDRMGGYRLRGEGRIYMPEKKDQYLALGLSFRHLIIRDEFAIGMEGVTNDLGMEEFAYFKNAPMVFHRFNTFVDLKWGVQKRMKNRTIDFYGGFSIRSIRVRSWSDIPEGGELPERRGFWTLEDGHRLNYPTPIIGFKIGFL